MSDQPVAVGPITDITAWQSVSLPRIPPELIAILEQIEALGTTVVNALQVAVDFLDIAVTLASAVVDAAKAVLRAAILAIEDALNTLVDSVGIYGLFVPVRRKVLVPPIVQEALALTGIVEGPRNKNVNLTALELQLAANNPRVAQFLKKPADGGNAGFVRTVVESIADTQDLNRPLFNDNTYVAGFHFLAGASDFAQLLGLITALDAILGQRGVPGLTVAGLPVPQNLRGLPYTDVTTGNRGFSLTWDGSPRLVQVDPLRTNCRITQVAIIRSENPKTLSATSPLTLFGTAALSVGTKTPDGKTEVVAILDAQLAAVPNTHIDTAASIKEGVKYYYYATYNIELAPQELSLNAAIFKPYGFYSLSNACPVTAQAKSVKTSTGAPPDWWRTPSLLRAIPFIEDLINVLITSLRQFEAGINANVDALKQYVAYLRKEVVRLQALIAEITAIIDRVTAILNVSTSAGVYGRTFYGKGGVNFMLADLAASLAPTNADPGRPPFDRGDEFVTGLVLLGGFPSEDGATKVLSLLDLLFGTAESATADALAQAVASIDRFLAAEEEVGFTADFTAGTGDAAQALAAETSATSSPDVPLSDTDPGSCSPDTTPPPTFGDDFGVVP